LFAVAAMLLSDRRRRRHNKKMGNDTVFLQLDTNARQSYENRAQSATGVIEHRE
jgi:hypothetical protein